MVIKRLMPLCEQFAPREITEAMHAQMEALSTAVSEEARKRDDDSLREGIQPPQKSEDVEQGLLDQADRAKTPAERDRRSPSPPQGKAIAAASARCRP